MKLIANNKRVFHDYEILKKYEAGISLMGSEVKSLRENGANLLGSFINISKNEAFLLNMNIADYKKSVFFQKHEPTRTRKLLLHKKEIKKISSLMKEQKMIAVPIKIYWTSKSLVKVEFGLGKPLKKYDLREKEKQKTIQKKLW